MDIQFKREQYQRVGGVVSGVIGVVSGCVDGQEGWIKKHEDRTVFYPSTHWELVEEWVGIQVPKNQIGRFNTMCSYVNGEYLKWRYPL